MHILGLIWPKLEDGGVHQVRRPSWLTLYVTEEPLWLCSPQRASWSILTYNFCYFFKVLENLKKGSHQQRVCFISSLAGSMPEPIDSKTYFNLTLCAMRALSLVSMWRTLFLSLIAFYNAFILNVGFFPLPGDFLDNSGIILEMNMHRPCRIM